MATPNELRTNEWIFPVGKEFSYQVFWPCAEHLDPNRSSADVFVRLNTTRNQSRNPASDDYVATFLTIEEYKRWFELFKQNGDYAHGTYIPGSSNDILLETITREKIERTIEDLIKQNRFFRVFKTGNS